MGTGYRFFGGRGRGEGDGGEDLTQVGILVALICRLTKIDKVGFIGQALTGKSYLISIAYSFHYLYGFKIIANRSTPYPG